MTKLMKALVKARPEPGLWMQEVPAGRPAKVVVLRDGKPLELTCVWRD